jgi:hypothetical protein
MANIIGPSDVDQCLAGFPSRDGCLALAQAYSRDCDLSNVGAWGSIVFEGWVAGAGQRRP